MNWNSSDPFRTVLKLVRGGAFKGWRWSGFGRCVCEYEVVKQFNFFENSCFPPEKNVFDFFFLFYATYYNIKGCLLLFVTE